MGVDIHKVIGKIPFKPKRGFVLPKHRYTGPCCPLPGQEPYNAVDAIAMRHDICYRDNEIGNADFDRKLLAELNGLIHRGGREKMDRQLVSLE